MVSISTRYANQADLIRGFCWRHLAQLAEAKQADEADGPITEIAGSPQIWQNQPDLISAFTRLSRPLRFQ